MTTWITDPWEIPPGAGGYGLGIRLQASVDLKTMQFRGQTLTPGLYLYAGSANGPGGLKSRVSRHLRADKKPHWHVDQLTGSGQVIFAALIPGGQECELVDLALKLGAETPVRGFGSSDCRRCAAHLLRLDEGFEVDRLGAGVVLIVPLHRHARTL